LPARDAAPRVARDLPATEQEITMLKYACALVASLLAAAAAHAQVQLTATLTNAAETVPVTPTRSDGTTPRPASFGTATFLVDAAMTSMTFSATVFNIDFTGTQTADSFDNLVAAHIHAGPTVTATTNGPVVWGFFGTPFNDTTPNDMVLTPFATGVGGTVSGKWDLSEGNATTLTAQLPNILAGHSYINFHTTQYPGGEIRGNIAAVAAVPEPETYALLLAGLGAVFLARRRRA
jgi:CHRD domain-containing protein/PEP-CTERM motif-containing protein